MSWSTLANWWKWKRTVAAIRHLDNHLRRDIGLDPIPTFARTEEALRILDLDVLAVPAPAR